MSENELLKHIPEVSYQKLKLLSGQSIGIRKWLMKEEKEFLFAIETQMNNKDLLIDECLKLSKKCSDDDALFETLSKNDLVFMLSKQRALSKGEKIDFTFKCNNTECSDYNAELKSGRSDNEAVVDLKKNIKTEPFDFTPIEINEYKFHLKDIPYPRVRLMEKDYLSNEDEPELFKLNHAVVLNSIKSVDIGEGEDEKHHDNFSLEQLDELLDTLIHDDYTELSNSIGKKISSFTIDKKVTCPICNHSSEVAYEELFSLMVF